MKHTPSVVLCLAAGLALLFCAPTQAQQHRATRLGNPATRFAPPLSTPEDLRARFRDEALKPDIASILRQWGWNGNLEDLHHAALSAEITEVSLPVGTRMPFMSSREDGKPVALRDVLWAGSEPVSAYAFTFSSNGRLYRCVTPKPCSNFYLEDISPAPKSALSIQCAAPAQVPLGRPVQIWLTVRNTGNVAEPQVTVILPVPEGATVTGATEKAVLADRCLTWTIAELAPDASQKLAVVFTLPQTGSLAFTPMVRGSAAPLAQTACESRVIGIPAILLETVDLEDPVEVGKEVTYVIKVTNQGTAPGTNIRVVCTLPDSEAFVSGDGVTPVQVQGRTVTVTPLPSLPPKAVATWRVVVKALKADDARFKADLSSDQFEQPIRKDEATQLY